MNNVKKFGDILKEMREVADGCLDADRADFEERVRTMLKDYASQMEAAFGDATFNLVVENVRMRNGLEWIQKKFWSGSDGGLHYQDCNEAREIISEALRKEEE